MEKTSETSSCCPQGEPCKVTDKSFEGADCKCDEGWQCVITRTSGPDAGKSFYKCEGDCVCNVDSDGSAVKESSAQKLAESSGATKSKAYCKCGEGWSCAITKTTGPDAGKTFFECAEQCTCEVVG